MSIINFIFKQYDVGNWWGAAKATFSNAAVYFSVFNTAMIVPMAYVTWIAPLVQQYGLEIPFWIFGVLVVVLGIVAMVLEYKLSTPSGFSFWSEQFWKHNNPIRLKMEEQDKRLENMERMLEQLIGKEIDIVP